VRIPRRVKRYLYTDREVSERHSRLASRWCRRRLGLPQGFPHTTDVPKKEQA
jgi:hypothetical protein